MKIISAPQAVLLTLLLAGCGGGGSTSVIPSGNPNVNPSPTPLASATPAGTATATPSPTGSLAPVNTAAITFTAPPRSAASGTVAPVTQIVAVIKSINGNATLPGSVNPTTVVAVTSSNCTTSTAGQQCNFVLPAPAGSISTVITEYAGSAAVATGSFTFTSTGAAGQTQNYALGGIPDVIAISPPALTLNQPSTQAVGVVISDPSGAVIGGTEALASNLTLNVTAGGDVAQLQLGNDASTLGTSVRFLDPSTQVNLVYNGGGFGQVRIDSSGTNYEIATQTGLRKALYVSK